VLSNIRARALSWAGILMLTAVSLGLAHAEHPKGPLILTEDVGRFYRVYEAAGGHPSADELDHGYIDPGSDGLHQFTKLRNVSGATLVAAIAKHPQTFADARRCAVVLPAVKQRLGAAFDKLARLYPEAKFPPVTVLIGRGNTGGTTSASGVIIGLETLCAADWDNPNVEDRFVHTIAHEYGHVQQPGAQVDPVNPTVLYASLIEGGAEFTAELISGDVANYRLKTLTKGHEAAIEAAFVVDEDKTDLSPWLYNGLGTPEHPGDLGYWVGYRIVKSYYQHASDKHQALRDIFEMKDPKAFLAESGWRPAAS